KNNDSPNVMFLNCGTGGIKYQVYSKKEKGIIFDAGEYKPSADREKKAKEEEKGKKTKEEVSVPFTGPNSLHLHSKSDLQEKEKYKPNPDNVLDDQKNKLYLIFELTGALSDNNIKKKYKTNVDVDIPIFAFVTGSLRGVWEDSRLKEEQKRNLDSAMDKYFGS